MFRYVVVTSRSRMSGCLLLSWPIEAVLSALLTSGMAFPKLAGKGWLSLVKSVLCRYREWKSEEGCGQMSKNAID